MVQFRARALKQLQKPDDLDLLARVTRLRGWVWLGALGVVVAGVIVFGFVGSLNSEVTATGLLSKPEGATIVESTQEGQVVNVDVADNSNIAAGAPIAQLSLADGTTKTIRSRWGGHVVGVPIDVGNVVQVGSPMMLLERSNVPHNRLLAFLFVEGSKGAGIAPGMPVDLNVSSAPSGAFGVLRGHVTAVDPFPATRSEVQTLLADQQLTDQFTAKGPPTIVTVDLDRDPKTVSGYRWSTGSGPPFPLTSRIQVTGTIIQGTQPPYKLVFGK